MSIDQTRVLTAADFDGASVLVLSLTNGSEQATITVTGEIDSTSAHLLTQLVDQAAVHRPDRVVLDLAGVTFFGAAGISMLLQANETIAAAGGRLLLRSPSRLTQRILTITETERLFELDNDATG